MAETYTGHVRDGVVVLDDGTPPPPDGTRVRVLTVDDVGLPDSGRPRSMADLLAGRLGRIRSGGADRLSEDCGAKLAEHLIRVHTADEATRP
jgi:hypothetical protein